MKTLSRDQFKQQFEKMTRWILSVRFKLAVHSEMRQLPVYALVVAKNGSNSRETPTPEPHYRREGYG